MGMSALKLLPLPDTLNLYGPQSAQSVPRSHSTCAIQRYVERTISVHAFFRGSHLHSSVQWHKCWPGIAVKRTSISIRHTTWYTCLLMIIIMGRTFGLVISEFLGSVSCRVFALTWGILQYWNISCGTQCVIASTAPFLHLLLLCARNVPGVNRVSEGGGLLSGERGQKGKGGTST